MRKALDELAVVEAAKVEQKQKPTKNKAAKASMTDPEARFMRMPDGGNRPAFNVQLAVDTESRAVVGVEVTNAGSDAGLAEPMRDQVQEQTGGTVEEQRLDGGYVRREDPDRAAASVPPVILTIPVPKPRKKDADPHQPKKTDSEAVAAWRVRMGTAEVKESSKDRASTIEMFNAELKTNRGVTPFRVRGIIKVSCVALWSVLAYNVMHYGWQMMSLASGEEGPGEVQARLRAFARLEKPAEGLTSRHEGRIEPKTRTGPPRTDHRSESPPNANKVKTIPAWGRTLNSPQIRGLIVTPLFDDSMKPNIVPDREVSL